MAFSVFDIITFVGFIALVVGVSLWASRGKKTTTEGYFLAGRGLSWWLIGFSLIASNISSEHFIGMSGQGFGLGLAIASFEWMSALTLIIIAFVFLPRFLSLGIYTMPEYLEFRYNGTARLIMAIFMVFFYVFVSLSVVLYSGALALRSIFGLNLVTGIWLIGIIAGGYTVYGGLKAVVWSDLIQGAALLLGGLLVTILSFVKVGGISRFVELSGDRLHTVLPWNHPDMPWVAVFIGGLWVPHIFYWGLNQFITQRTLAAKTLQEGQKGMIFGASMKILIPFIVVFPGIIAFELYGDLIPSADEAYPYLIQQVLPAGLIGIMFAALFGAVMSTLDSLLNSAATILTLDIYQRHIKKDSSTERLVLIGRIVTVALIILGCLWAPIVDTFDKGLYMFLQQFWGFIQPGVVAAFVYGIVWKKVPANAAIGGMLLNLPVYGLLLWFLPDVAFLHHMAITFVIISLFMITFTLLEPRKNPQPLPVIRKVESEVTPGMKIAIAGIVITVVSLYTVFF